MVLASGTVKLSIYLSLSLNQYIYLSFPVICQYITGFAGNGDPVPPTLLFNLFFLPGTADSDRQRAPCPREPFWRGISGIKVIWICCCRVSTKKPNPKKPPKNFFLEKDFFIRLILNIFRHLKKQYCLWL